MKKLFAVFALLTAMPVAVMAAEPSAGSESGPAGAAPPGYQAWRGQATSSADQGPAHHVAAAAAHDQAAAHHRAAAEALQSGKIEEAKGHALAAEKAAAEACAKSKESLSSGQSK